MKEKILRLAELKYYPESTKIEELLNLDRVDTREAKARAELAKIIEEREEVLKKERGEEGEGGIYL
jgi:hypothetical protein